MPITITKVVARDIRFPTSENLDGSDAMNQAPDYSAAHTTSAGWLGYPDEKVRRLSREAVEAGWEHVKIKGRHRYRGRR